MLVQSLLISFFNNGEKRKNRNSHCGVHYHFKIDADGDCHEDIAYSGSRVLCVEISKDKINAGMKPA